MTASDVTWRKLWWVVVVPVICWFLVLTLYIIKFWGGLSSDQAKWGQLGDYVGGLINPVISLIGLLAVIVSLRANAVAIDETRRQLRAQLFAEGEGQFVALEQLFATVPTALKFHGIDPEELEQIGVTPAEFAYLQANFTAGGINVRAMEDPEIVPFTDGDYYRTMLESPHTRRAWPVLKRLMAPSPYRQRIEATITLIENREEAASWLRQAEATAAPDSA